ncbi:MAG TPA: tetratricopeptide repeat protein [Chitinophagaceae bacterium]|nr:tetratricopeptide repeat protein [Chitinophagaceae bacterium]
MKKIILTMLTVAFATSFAISQTVDDGIKFIYYQRYKSATETLQKVIASKPKDAYSIYWLGQAYLADDKIDSAKAVYQKALNDGVNDPWIWIGTGHEQILENNDVNSAKQKFEQAITATKGKKGVENADILNAIGRAMADGSSQQGDPAYGVEKLKRAAQINTTNPDIDINLGICYLKQGSDKGGVAVEAFTDATRRNAQYAEAYFRIGKIYESQNNTEYMNEWFGKATAADPAYAPVYLEYFEYYKERDVNVAKEHLDKYVANADKDCKTDYFVADYLYRAGKNQESIAKAKEMENGACKDYVRVNILYAYNYNKMGDSVSAYNAIQKFFASESGKVDTSASDYAIAGIVAGKVGQTDSAVAYIQKAYEIDTVQQHRSTYIDTISSIYKRAKKYQERLQWVQKAYALNPNPTNRDVYDLGEAAYFAGNYELADSVFKVYEQKFPDQIYGPMWRFKVAQAADTSMEKGMIVQPANEYLTFLKQDTTKYKTSLIQVHGTLAGYYANVAKNKDSAIYHLEQILVYDPGNPDAQKYIEALTKPATKQPAEKSPGAKPKTKPKSGAK